MPFKSEAQKRWMFKNKPEMAKEWEKETPKFTKLPEKVGIDPSKPQSFMEMAKARLKQK